MSGDAVTDVCRIEADNDMVGIGVRIGAYLQWLASIIAIAVLPDRVVSYRTR